MNPVSPFVTALTSLLVIAACPSVLAQRIDTVHPEPLSQYVFGYNLEHTRGTVSGGLSAQMIQNRKFAGKPSRNLGVAAHWSGVGDKVFYMMGGPSYTRHNCLDRMRRGNELAAQFIQNLVEGQVAGISQGGIHLQAGKTYSMRIVTRAEVDLDLEVSLVDASGMIVYAHRVLPLHDIGDWEENAFTLASGAEDSAAVLRITFTRKAEVVVGAVSMLPEDNFHGMRRDVVSLLGEISPKMLRWPGGNFAGEYRWKDGLLPPDQRGPLQAATEIETQPFTDGYDYHEISTDDFLALCGEVGAEPMLTINLAWNTPEESAEWVAYCNAPVGTPYGDIRAERGHPEPYNVKYWSLGNEMGYVHMEGPAGPQAYASLARTHAEAMLEVDPTLEFCSSGPYPNDNWAEHSAAALLDVSSYASVHHYASFGTDAHYTTEAGTEATYNRIVAGVAGNLKQAEDMRVSLNRSGAGGVHMSFDEWNVWYAWYRPSSVAEAIYCARVEHFLIAKSAELDFPIACFFQPVAEGAVQVGPTSCSLTADGQVFALMAAHQDALRCPVEDNDDFSMAATIRDGVLTISMVNYDYSAPRRFTFPVRGAVLGSTLLYSDEVGPYSRFDEKDLELTTDARSIFVTLPPHSVGLVKIQLKGG